MYPPPATPQLPQLTPPLLYLLLSVHLLHDTVSLRRTRAAPHQVAALLLCVFSLSLFVASLFHVHYTTSHQRPDAASMTLHPLLRQVATPAPGNPALPPPVAPSPSPMPPTAPVTQPPPSDTVVQPAPVGPGVPQQPGAPVDGGGRRTDGPTLDECRGGLLRMQVLLLLEFLAECGFLVLRLLSTNDEDEPTCEISFRVFTLFRAVYAVPVVALNASILFIGGSPTGSCLPANPAVQVAYTHLILYALFTIVFLVVAMVRLINYDSEKDDTTTGYYYSGRTSYTGSLGFPPSRTESYYRRRPGRSSTDYYSDDETGFWGTVCPCC